MKTFLSIFFTSLLFFGSFSAFANDISREEIRQIKELAHDLEKGSRKLHDRAEFLIPTPNSSEEIFIESLHRFNRVARKFHRNVEGNLDTPMSSRKGFFNLIRDFNNVSRTIEKNIIFLEIEVLYLQVLANVESINAYYNFWNYMQVKELAHQMDKAASKIYRAILSELREGRTSHERGALEALSFLADTADAFHEGIEENFSTPANTRVLLRDLLDAQFDAEFEVEYINISPRLFQELRSLTLKLKQLQVIYRWRWTL